MNTDKRNDSKVALTSYLACQENEGGIDNPAATIYLSTFNENENKDGESKENSSNRLNCDQTRTSDEVLINLNSHPWDSNHYISSVSGHLANGRRTSYSKLKTILKKKKSKSFKSRRTSHAHKQIESTSIPPLLCERKSGRLSNCSYTYDVKSNRGYPSPRRWLVERAKRSCTKKILYKRIPILSWLPEYDGGAALSDLVAGFTVGLTVIPQAIAYANVAGLPPQYGLYSSFMACFIYTIFGSCKDSPMGPTAISSILTRENLHGHGPEFAVLLCFLSGCVELLMGILQLGFLIDFISGPVSAGFTSAAAIIIATSQVKDILGLSISSGKFLDIWDEIFHRLSETRLWDAVLGIGCMSVLLVLRKVKDIQIGSKDSSEKTKFQNLVSQFLWFMSTSRNIIVVVVCAVMAYSFEASHSQPFILTGTVKAGLPELKPPPFEATVGNVTYSFVDMSSSLGSALLVVPLLAILENIALAKVFANGKSIDATQEMLAIGLCNIGSSFVGSMPVSGALSRGAVNNASGVQTTFGGIYTGIIVILSLQFFTPYFFYIPKASLAAVIIAAVVFMVEFHVVKPMWKTKKIDLIPACATFLSCLFIRLELGIVIGIGINVLFLLYASARPSVRVEKLTTVSGCEYLRITPDRSLVFPSVEYVRNIVTKAGLKQGSSYIPVVINSRHIQGVDFTAAKGIKNLIDDFTNRKQPILFYNLKPSIVEIFQGVQPKEFNYCKNEIELNDFLKQYHVLQPTSEESKPGY